MLVTARNLTKTATMGIVMALTLLLVRGLYGENEITALNLVPLLFSVSIGIALVFLYLTLFPSQRKDRFFTFLLPGAAILVLVIVTGLSKLWLVDELMILLGFVFAGQEISQNSN